jgi:hypothetical protein
MAFDEKYNDFNSNEIRGDDILVSMNFTALPGAISDYVIYFYGKLRVSDSDANAIVKCSTTTGEITITDVPSKTCQAKIPPAQTNVLPLTRSQLFCEWKVKASVGGDIYTVDGGRGSLFILPDILETPT